MATNKRTTTKNYDKFREHYTIASSKGFYSYIKAARNYYNGNQFPEGNEKNFIRVCLNLVSYAVRSQTNRIVGTPVFTKFTSDNDEFNCLKLERFDQYNCSETKLKEKTNNSKSVINGFVDGVDISMYRWDSKSTHYQGIWRGKLTLDHIDPENFAVSEIENADIQNQEWVMYRSIEKVAAVREMCDRGEEVKAHIKPDSYDSTSADSYSDISDRNSVLVYTRFFRLDGEVFFMCSTRDVDLFKYPRSLNPNTNARLGKAIEEDLAKRQEEELDQDVEKEVDYAMDYESITLPYIKKDHLTDKEFQKDKEKFYLYPIAIFNPFPVWNRWWGKSLVYEMITLQDYVNYALSMSLKCVENNAYSKYIVKEGALQGQEITNEPGQVLIDYSKMTNGRGIDLLTENTAVPNGLLDNVGKAIEMMKVFYSFSDVSSGIAPGQMSGVALQFLTNQASIPIEQQQQIYYSFLADKAAIRVSFYKFFVDNAVYTYEIPGSEYLKKEGYREYLKDAQDNGKLLIEGGENMDFSTPAKHEMREEFSGKEIAGIRFDINIEVQQGIRESAIVEAQMFETLILNGGIQNMTPQMLLMYIEGNPMVSERMRQALKGVYEKLKTDKLTVLEEENAALKEKLGEAAELLRRLTAANEQGATYTKNLQKEFTDKINSANAYIDGLSRELESARKPQVQATTTQPSAAVQKAS